MNIFYKINIQFKWLNKIFNLNGLIKDLFTFLYYLTYFFTANK